MHNAQPVTRIMLRRWAVLADLMEAEVNEGRKAVPFVENQENMVNVVLGQNAYRKAFECGCAELMTPTQHTQFEKLNGEESSLRDQVNNAMHVLGVRQIDWTQIDWEVFP